MSDTQSIAPGWYPDPMVAAQRRWWSGIVWTEHVEAQQLEAEQIEAELVVDVGDDERIVPQRSAQRPVSSEQAVADALAARSGRADPYRDRQIVSKFALAFAVVGLVGVSLQLVVDIPDLLQFVFGNAPITVSGIAFVLAFRTNSSIRLPLIAALISVSAMAGSYAFEAASMTDTLNRVL